MSNYITLHKKFIQAQSKDFLELSLIVDTSFYGCRSGNILQLMYLEYDSGYADEPEHYNAVRSEFFAAHDVETAMTAFNYRYNNPMGADTASDLGQSVEDILGAVVCKACGDTKTVEDRV
jgi:hypothetical protein